MAVPAPIRTESATTAGEVVVTADISQDGGGDDLFIEVTIPKQGAITTC